MVLNNTKIKKLISDSGLLENHKPENIKNASYTISVGRVFSPESGDEIVFKHGEKNKQHHIQIKPGEIIVIMSKEQIKMPLNLCASYNPTFMVSKRGLNLINNSIIEPGYEGHVSCIFANFSRVTAKLSLNDAIVKLVFYELATVVEELDVSSMTKETISTNDYIQKASKMASDFHCSFLNIETLEARILAKSIEAVKSQVKWGGIFIALLLVFATLQPFISKWIYMNDVTDNYTLKGALIERLIKLESLDSTNKKKFEAIYDSLKVK